MKVVMFLVKSVGFVFGFGALAMVIMALGGPIGWPFELFSSWPYLIAAIGTASAVVAGMCRWPRLGTIVFGGSVVLVALAMASPGDLTRARAPTPNPENLQLIWGNAMRNDTSVTTLMGRANNPNKPVLAIGEIPSRWQWEGIAERQALNRVKAGDGLIGIGVEGCAPTGVTYVTQSLRAGRQRTRTFALRVRCPGYTLFAVHLTNPLWEWGQRLQRRNQELSQLAQAVGTQQGPVVVIGDFNTAPNAVPFSRFMKQSNLSHTSCGGRWLPTWRPLGWRSKFKDGNPLTGIPIDHLFTRDIQVVSCTVGSDFGSDHLPLIVELKKPSANLPAEPTP
jgi:endonuclease/exonuclease/phosphatase (EEP) superfamily protein YafD